VLTCKRDEITVLLDITRLGYSGKVVITIGVNDGSCMLGLRVVQLLLLEYWQFEFVLDALAVRLTKLVINFAFPE
jgi:hypothetical protein